MMSLRACRFLAAVALILFCSLALACSREHTQQAGSVDWHDMTPIPFIQQDGSRTVISASDVQEQIGFELILPSYLPPNMSKSYSAEEVPRFSDDSEQSSAAITFFPVYADFHHREGLTIELIEKRRESDKKVIMPLGTETFQIAQTTVDCYLTPNEYPSPTIPAEMATRIAEDLSLHPFPTFSPPTSPQFQLVTELPPALATTLAPLPFDQTPRLSCNWQTENLDIEITFSWELQQPVPGVISSDMHDEAMRVVTSMIEAPYIP